MKTMLKGALLAGIAAVPMTVPIASQAHAQTAARNYSIAAQPLDDALRQFASQSGRDVVFDPRLVEGKTSTALQGSYSTEAGLRRLLEGTGVSAFSTSNGFAIRGNGGAVGGPAEPTPSVASAVNAIAPGTIVDGRTGAALRGALVEIIETKEKTATGDLGDFRFPGRSGRVRLRISYLGYPQQEREVELRDGKASTGIALFDGGEPGEIVVTAQLSARAQALNQERTAENTSTVISADLLGQFDGTTISDALRRAPGVAFVADPGTGDGTNVIVRGLSPDFNTVTLNGLRLPVGSGLARSPSLNNILADSVSKITINKTLLPNQDGSGTGALVDIETKDPLDRPARYFSFTAEKAGAAKSFLDEKFISGTVSWKFGANENFGISLSAQYRGRSQDQIIVSSSGGAFLGQYLPATFDGRPVFSPGDIDPRTEFPFEAGVEQIYPNLFNTSQNFSKTKNLALSASAQWKIGGHTNLRFDFQRNKATLDSYTRSLSLLAFNDYELLPVAAEGGETRPALVWEDYIAPGLPMSLSQGYTIIDGKDNTTTNVGIRGESFLGRWEMDYKIGYAIGKDEAPNRFSLTLTRPGFPNFPVTRSDLAPEALANSINGRLISPFLPLSSGRIQLPAFSDSGFDLLNDESLYRLSNARNQSSSGENSRVTAALDLKRNVNSNFLKYVQAGVFFERSKSEANPVGSTGFSQYRYNGPLQDLGLGFESGSLSRIGFQRDVDLIGTQSLYDFYDSVRRDANPLLTKTVTEASPLFLQDSIREDNLSGYLQAQINIGRLQFIGGLRVEQVRTATNVISGSSIVDADGNFDTEYFNNSNKILSLKGVERTTLPRVMANYHVNEDIIVRAGYYRSVVRPRLENLSAITAFSLDMRPLYGPNSNQGQIFISAGNPNLKSSSTDNLDISLEWYDKKIGVLKAGAFYKPTKNAFFSVGTVLNNSIPDNLKLPDDPRFHAPGLFITYNSPQNSDKLAKLWGFEFSAERQFTFLPGILSGLGFYGNYTFTKSSRREVFGYFYAPDGVVVFEGVPYAQQPTHSGTAALTFSRKNIDASVSYTRQSSYEGGVPAYGQVNLRAPISSLDARVEYRAPILGAKLRFYLEGANLLKGTNDANISDAQRFPNLNLTSPVFESYLGGRSLRLGVSASF